MVRHFSELTELLDLAEERRQKGYLKGALESVGRCLEKRPDHPRGLLLWARLHYQQGQLAEALKALRSLGTVAGEDALLRSLAGNLERLGQIRRSQSEPAFSTEAMAGLLIEQGYLLEAVGIYRQLFVSSGEKDRRLWQAILDLEQRLRREGSKGVDGEKLARELEELEGWIGKQWGEL